MEFIVYSYTGLEWMSTALGYNGWPYIIKTDVYPDETFYHLKILDTEIKCFMQGEGYKTEASVVAYFVKMVERFILSEPWSISWSEGVTNYNMKDKKGTTKVKVRKHIPPVRGRKSMLSTKGIGVRKWGPMIYGGVAYEKQLLQEEGRWYGK